PMSCMLRVSGENFDVDTFLAQSQLEPNNVWHKGEPRYKNQIRLHSGFSVIASNADMDDPQQQVEEVIVFLKTNQNELAKLRDFPNVEEPILDFGIRDRDVAVQSDRFPAELLHLAGSLNIGLEVSRYP
ncbi:DUF4279 domain-containing protein, partial [bacterium]